MIAWNTVYMAAAIDRLRIDGHPVQESDLATCHRAGYEHINPYGKYAFEVSEDLGGAKLRPLRSGPASGLALFFVRLLREGRQRRAGGRPGVAPDVAEPDVGGEFLRGGA